MNVNKFTEFREHLNLSVEEAAKVLGMSRANAFKFQNGTRPITLSMVYSMEAFLLLGPEQQKRLIQQRKAHESMGNAKGE
jgi:plasmid maintenance system antidote protein VapI